MTVNPSSGAVVVDRTAVLVDVAAFPVLVHEGFRRRPCVPGRIVGVGDDDRGAVLVDEAAGTVVEDVIVRLVGEGAVVVLEDQHRSAVPAFLVRRGLPVVGHVVHRLRSASNDPCSVSAR